MVDGKEAAKRDDEALRYVADGGMLRDLGLVRDGAPNGPGAMAAPELAGAVVRTLARRIESLGDSLRGRIARGEDRIDALETAEAELAVKLLGHDAAIRGLVERADRQDRAALGEANLTTRALAQLTERIADVERIVSVHGPKIGDLRRDLVELAAGRRKDLDAADRATGEIHQRIDALGSRTEGIPQLRRELSELGAEVLRIADDLRARIGGLELEVFPVLRGGEVRDSGGGSHRFPAFVRYTPEPGLVTPGLTSERVYQVLGRDTRFLRLAGDDGKPVTIAPRFLVAVPGPASTADLDQRDRGVLHPAGTFSGAAIPGPLLCSGCRANEGEYHDEACPTLAKKRAPGRVPFLPLEDFLTPPPLARKIGKAVMRAADGLPIHDRRTVNATLLGERLALVLRTIPTKPGEAHDLLTDTIAEAKRAGVIP